MVKLDRFESGKNHALFKDDRSRKGSIDKRISSLCKLFNDSKHYYTTSSCSGRIMIIDRGFGRKKDADWLFVSHEPVKAIDVFKAIGKLPNSQIRLKQEPFIIHICAEFFEDAEALLETAKACGLKRAGIISMSGKIMIEIVANENIETIIADKGKLLVSTEYIERLIELANKKLENNFERLKKLERKVEELVKD